MQMEQLEKKYTVSNSIIITYVHVKMCWET